MDGAAHFYGADDDPHRLKPALQRGSVHWSAAASCHRNVQLASVGDRVANFSAASQHCGQHHGPALVFVLAG